MSCICGNKIVHSAECKKKNQYVKLNKKRKEDRKFLKEAHMCYSCKREVKPIVIYPSRCPCCAKKNYHNPSEQGSSSGKGQGAIVSPPENLISKPMDNQNPQDDSARSSHHGVQGVSRSLNHTRRCKAIPRGYCPVGGVSQTDKAMAREDKTIQTEVGSEWSGNSHGKKTIVYDEVGNIFDKKKIAKTSKELIELMKKAPKGNTFILGEFPSKSKRSWQNLCKCGNLKSESSKKCRSCFLGKNKNKGGHRFWR